MLTWKIALALLTIAMLVLVGVLILRGPRGGDDDEL